jgi:hypothetical protein
LKVELSEIVDVFLPALQWVSLSPREKVKGLSTADDLLDPPSFLLSSFLPNHTDLLTVL